VSAPLEATLSLRWIRPFIRVTGANPAQLELLATEGIGLRELALPDTRYSHRLAMALLRQAVEDNHNPRLGLQAGEAIEPGDMDVLEYAARSCANLREATLCAGRYMGLMHTGQQLVLSEEGERAIWELRQVDDVPRPPASNDFTLTSACTFVRRHTGKRGGIREVHFAHEVATDMAEYERIFDGATIKLGMPHNALVLVRSHLDIPMLDANPGLKAAFELHAEELLERLKRTQGTSGRVRQMMVEQLRSGDVGMESLAGQLAMSVSTLRRRLADEGITHTELLEGVRSELAEKYLLDSSLAISEVAFLLGFSHVTAFYNAFRRWKDMTPVEFRTKHHSR
jgi:AraC-like DNA-binding protein